MGFRACAASGQFGRPTIGASNLVLDGGILELAAGNFTRGIGTSSAQVQWTANGGGFSASGGSRAVNIGGSGATLTWGSGVFVPGGSPLMLGSPSDDSTLVFQNPINLGSSIQTIEVNHGSAAVDAILSGNLTGTGGSAGYRQRRAAALWDEQFLWRTVRQWRSA